MNGNVLRNVVVGTPFAVKSVDFTKNDPFFSSSEGKQKKRDSYEMEKHILTICDHPNIVTIRMAINMGEVGLFANYSTGKTYLQLQRVYLIMDFAELGSLGPWLWTNKNSMLTTERMQMTVDLFKGLKYLHDMGITHGDIHLGNVLLFREDNRIVAKWADFGMGFIGQSDRFLPTSRQNLSNLLMKKRRDCEKLAYVYRRIWDFYNPDIDSEELKQLGERFIQFIACVRDGRDLDSAQQQFSDIIN